MPEFEMWTGKEGFRRTDPEQVAAEMFRELRTKVRLTWNDNELGDAARQLKLKANRIGNFYPNLPHVRIHKRYFIQNGRVMDSAGQYISIDSIPDPVDKRVVAESYLHYRDQALAADDKLCRECALVRCEKPEDMIRHLAKAHPDKLKALSEEEETPPGPVQSETGQFKCACDARFETAGDLISHAKTHTRASAGA